MGCRFIDTGQFHFLLTYAARTPNASHMRLDESIQNTRTFNSTLYNRRNGPEGESSLHLSMTSGYRIQYTRTLR